MKSEIKTIVNDLVNDFSNDNLKLLFREKTNNLSVIEDNLALEINDDRFGDVFHFGDIELEDESQILIGTIFSKNELSDKSGKKAQYEIARKILKQEIRYKAGLFFFYDSKKDFRLSLVYDIPESGGKRSWSNFKRYTYYVSKDQTNNTFINTFSEIKSFDTLDTIIQAFSVEKVTKEFYLEIALLFTQLTGGERKIGKNTFNEVGLLKIPSGNNESIKKEFGVRLLGRLLFCWFLKKKKSKNNLSLISDEVLSIQAVHSSENYYHDTIEPLFYEILNTKIENRYEKFQSTPWNITPFLNGGLFEPSYNDYYELDKILLLSKYFNTLNIPNDWFLKLFEVFDRYNFTIDENTTNDAEISIDPEMLGKLFENLLAEINEQTGDTARKSTGSFYTPRPIVDYMVNESLLAYLEQKLVGQSSLIDTKDKFETNDKFDSKDKSPKTPGIKHFTKLKRHLPHWQNPGCVYFITFRAHNGFILNDSTKDIVANTIKFHNKKKYQLFSFVIMPDHIHIILQPLEITNNVYYNLSEITHSLKSYSANEINKSENQKGRVIWQHESWDRIIRDETEFNEKMNYILNNPVKKGLIDNGYNYKWYYQVGQSSLIVKNKNDKDKYINENVDLEKSSTEIVDNEKYDRELSLNEIVDINCNSQSGMIDLPIQDRLRNLISNYDEPLNFNKNEIKLIINALDNLKVLDPACGSGAFPMGVLHTIQMILQKLDPDCSMWLNKVLEDIKDLNARRMMEKKLKGDSDLFDFTRKIGIIQKSIYGVDIQEIAVEISKLRCFLSIVVEEKIDDNDYNRGIQPLPNLEFKFVAANTLIGLAKPDLQTRLFDINDMFEELRQRREEYFQSYGEDKKDAEKQYIKIQGEITDILIKDRNLDKDTKEFATKLAGWNPFEHKSSSWFEPEWMFGIKDGFDIVIGNPPWGAKLNDENIIKRYLNVNKNLDSSEYFIYLLSKITIKNSIVSFIVPKSILFANNWNHSRNIILSKNLIGLADAGITFENVNLESIAFILSMSNKTGDLVNITRFEPIKKYCSIKAKIKLDRISQNVMIKSESLLVSEFNEVIWSIINKIQSKESFISNFDREVFRGLYISDNDKSKMLDKGQFRFINKVPDVGMYNIRKITNIDFGNSFYEYNRIIDKLTRDRIIIKVLRGNRLTATYCPKSILSTEKLVNLILTDKRINLKYVLAILNSKLTSLYLSKAVFSDITETSRVMDDCYLKKVPLLAIDIEIQSKFIDLVDIILVKKTKNEDTSKEERQIDLLVYDLYSLSAQEIAIIEKNETK